MKTHKQDKKGFTIIEVVLVLAIAGLIFLIVFLAVPALQRSQRDTQRRSDMGRFLSQLTQYQSNTGGQLPDSETKLTTFRDNYMTPAGTDDKFADPSEGVVYVVDYHGGASEAPASTVGTIDYYKGAKCDASQTSGVAVASGDRTVAIQTKLEGGGHFCQDNL